MRCIRRLYLEQVANGIREPNESDWNLVVKETAKQRIVRHFAPMRFVKVSSLNDVMLHFAHMMGLGSLEAEGWTKEDVHAFIAADNEVYLMLHDKRYKPHEFMYLTLAPSSMSLLHSKGAITINEWRKRNGLYKSE